jgi:hypothetical protein
MRHGQLSDDDSISYSQKAVELIDEEPKKPEEGIRSGLRELHLARIGYYESTAMDQR